MSLNIKDEPNFYLPARSPSPAEPRCGHIAGRVDPDQSHRPNSRHQLQINQFW